MMISMLGWLLVPLYLAMAIILLRWSSRPPKDSSCCAICGYDITHACTPRCSECGADLLRDGIVTPQIGRTPHPGRRPLAATLVLVPLVIVTGMFVTRASFQLLRKHATEERITIDAPQSGAYRAFIWEGMRTARGDQVEFSPYCLYLEYADGTRSRALCVNVRSPNAVSRDRTRGADGSVAAVSPPILTEDDVPIERLHAWARDIGLDPDDAAIAAELLDMQRAVRSFRGDGGTIAQPLTSFGGRTNAALALRPTGRLPASLFGFATALLVLAAGSWATIAARHRTQNAQREAARVRFGARGSIGASTPKV